MTNTPKIGRVYHVVDKTTGEVVKVGSTTQTLKKRFSGQNYKGKYVNHFLVEVHRIESSEYDQYEKGNPFCPFLWHLIASEHLEILRARTLRKGVMSNHQSPLDQKFFGFDGSLYGRAGNDALTKEMRSRGGKTTGKRNADSGFMASLGRNTSHEVRVRNSSKGGRKRVESGFFSREHQMNIARSGGLVSGRNNANSGHCARIAGLGGHTRWHVKKGVISSSCAICKGNQNELYPSADGQLVSAVRAVCPTDCGSGE